MRRDQLCDPGLCPNSTDGARCDDCPLDRLEGALRSSDAGYLIRSALEIEALAQAGLNISSDEVPADVANALVVIQHARARLQKEQAAEKPQ
jgi:hypothetical protein